MTKFRLNRRTVLKGAGTIAIALPWMEIMESRASAQAAPTPAKRFLGVFQPGGTVREKYTPTGSETAPTLSPILSPLEPVKDKILIVDGLNMNSAVGEQHQRGIIGWLTGSVQVGTGGSYGYSKDGPSIDQILNEKLSKGKKFPGGLQMAVRWGTGKAHGNLSPISCATFATDGKFSPIAPKLDPQQIFKDVFGDLSTGGGSTTNSTAMVAASRRKSILDFVDKKYVALGAKLGAADKRKLDDHLTKIRELETTITVPPPVVTATCKAPPLVMTSDYNPTAGKASSDSGSAKDLSSDSAIPKVGQFMMDMLIMAMACDMTGTGLMQWSDTEAKHTFPWLSLSEHHHYYQHDGGFKPKECEQICTWYSKQHLYLIQAMDKVDMGGHTLLDESVVFFGSEIQDPPAHGKTNMPFLLAGKGGGMKPGRWLKFNGTSHNGLLLGILNQFGDMRTSIGSASYQAPAIKLT